MSRVSDARRTYDALNARPFFRAAMQQGALALAAFALAALFAWPFGAGVSGFGVLLIHMMLNAGMAARAAPPEQDGETLALEAFAAEPLGVLVAEAKDQLVRARREVGRDAIMHRPFDRLVRAIRKLERRLALDPKLRPELNRVLIREMPLVGSTAEQYVRMLAREGADSERLVPAEGILREAVERMETLADAKGRPDGPVVGMVRLDADAEVLADYMATDLDTARQRAAILRLAHRLVRAGRAAVPELEEKMKGVAGLLEARAALPGVQALAGADGARLLALAETPDMDVETRAALRKMLIDWRGTIADLSSEDDA